ncbi:cytochrome b [Craterilacuibacter sp. RT1T]|uniref:cytochrome b n=1 Tax=Craterilacuibacter sp. RT1T TaxID=2942211 RepID=UPI0020BDC269|nr:cytochrome b [Craterilacuibacter sp. RT1T]MCL6263000.1 cytochrome b [Craterilacuibacter sp. RT1T]
MMAAKAYAPLQVCLHWLMAVLIVATLGGGFYVAGLALSPAKFRYLAWHKWAGFVVLLLVFMRLAARLRYGAPALPGHMAPLARVAAHAGHLALYGLMLTLPLTGWLMSSAKGIPLVLFTVLPVPDLLAANPELAGHLAFWHPLLAYTLAAFIGLHVLAALKHHYLDRDGLLFRMRLRQP